MLVSVQRELKGSLSPGPASTLDSANPHKSYGVGVGDGVGGGQSAGQFIQVSILLHVPSPHQGQEALQDWTEEQFLVNVPPQQSK